MLIDLLQIEETSLNNKKKVFHKLNKIVESLLFALTGFYEYFYVQTKGAKAHFLNKVGLY